MFTGYGNCLLSGGTYACLPPQLYEKIQSIKNTLHESNLENRVE